MSKVDINRIGEAVAEAWFGQHGSGDIEFPVSVVAALALANPPGDQVREVAAQLRAAEPAAFVATVRGLWHRVVRDRPDLVNTVWPLVEVWERERPLDPQTVRAVKAVGEAALSARVFAATDEVTRYDYDVLGTVLTLLRPKSALQGRGQFYTPPELTTLMARLLGQPHQAVNDPACGTGGMFRATAEVMRDAGRDPGEVWWVGIDIDSLAIACCGANSLLWGLGWNVLFAVGDALAEDPLGQAWARRQETVTLARDLAALRLVLAAEPSEPRIREDGDAA